MSVKSDKKQNKDGTLEVQGWTRRLSKPFGSLYNKLIITRVHIENVKNIYMTQFLNLTFTPKYMN